MDRKDLFWKDIAIKLEQTYILKSPPSEWKKGEIEIFLQHFKDVVILFREENELEHAQDVKISYDTFRRVLIKKETKGSDYTRNIFAQYFGEKSYLDYVHKLEIDPPIEKEETTQSTKRTNILIFSVLLGAISLFTYAMFFSDDNKEEACLELKNLVNNAIRTEFGAYKSVPNSEVAISTLKQYFWEDSEAYKKILRVVENEKKRKWVMTNDSNISNAELMEFDCLYVDEDVASFSTKEHWNIQWFDTKINEYAYIYDTINVQTYFLKKRDGKWKISINNYDISKDKVFVKIFDDDDFNHSLSVNQLKKKIVTFMASGDTQSALWYLLKCAEKYAPHILQDVILLSGNLQNNVRRVNTKEIDISMYYNLNKEIDIKIFDLLNQV